MRPARTFRNLLAALGLALGLGVLAAGPLATGFLNDDYLFLEQARTRPLAGSLVHGDALGNYARPLSRQVYFAALTRISNGSPRVFHAVNFALFLGALALAADLMVALLPPVAACTAVLAFALVPLQRVGWLWISCSQDLLALVGSLGALALYRRSRRALAFAVAIAALASKESALALPALLAGWDVLIERRPVRETAMRVAPFAALTLAWAVLALRVSLGGSGARWLHFGPASFVAAYVHEVQALLGLDHPAGMAAALTARGPDPGALILFALAWLALPVTPGADAAPATRRRIALYAALWLVAAGFVTGPVAATWSSYYYMLCAVGGALLFGLAFWSLRRWGATAVTAGLLWWHAGGTGVRSFATTPDPWSWTSHLTSYYFERAAALTDTLSRQLRTLEPAPPHGARFFFATLPPWAGFQMGSGALVRELYRDPSLESWFYSQYSESTAADRPCRFFYWDGRALRVLYPHVADPSFQIGCDLLLLDRPAAAAWAFRRGFGGAGDRADLTYWLGWAEMWNGRRDLAERAWLDFGALDDTLKSETEIVSANHALTFGDTVGARRHLAAAIRSGIGRPVPHAVLGELLLPSQPKYGLMELSVAVWLNPEDLRTRRLLAAGLARARLEGPALRHLEAIEARDPGWRFDPGLIALDRQLRGGSAAAAATVVGGP